MTVLALLLALAFPEGDRRLVERLKRRDPEALAELYDRYGRFAYSLIIAIVRDAATAEDLVQETFLRVWNRVHAFDGERGAMGPWLLTIARNRAIDYTRSVTARMSRNASTLEEREHPSLFNTERDVIDSDQGRIVRNALGKLNENQRKVIELAYFEGLSQTEMAEKLGLSLGTVKTWVRAALKNLREELHVPYKPPVP